MLQQAYGEDCLSRTQYHEWYQRFKSDRTSVEDDPNSGRPSTSMDDDRVEKVLAVIRQNRPDLTPADFFLFPNLKSSLKGRRFQTVEETEENSTRDLRAIPQNTFQDAFQNWKKRWERCIKSGGGYFEGHNFD